MPIVILAHNIRSMLLWHLMNFASFWCHNENILIHLILKPENSADALLMIENSNLLFMFPTVNSAWQGLMLFQWSFWAWAQPMRGGVTMQLIFSMGESMSRMILVYGIHCVVQRGISIAPFGNAQWISNFMPHLDDCNYLSILGLNLIHVGKMGHGPRICLPSVAHHFFKISALISCSYGSLYWTFFFL